MRIGIMGGIFDPIHNAHLLLAQVAQRRMGLAQIIFLPSGTPPHKSDLVPAADRLAMVRLATQALPWAVVSDAEVRRGGVRYTVDTLRLLRHSYPQDEFYYIVGADALRDMPLWRDAATAMTMCEVVALSRPDTGDEVLLSSMRSAIKETGAKVTLLIEQGLDISSSMVRERVQRGERVEELVPREVARYIEAKGLYR